MKNFNFFEKLWEHSRTLRRVGLVLVMCLTIGIGNAWGASNIKQYTRIYFDNSKANWNYDHVYLCANDEQIYEMSKITNTKLYWHFRTDGDWNACPFVRIIATSASWSTPGGWKNIHDNAENATNTYDTYNYDKDCYSVIQAQKTGSVDDIASITVTYLGNKDAWGLNKTITMKAKVMATNADSYSETNTPGALSASSYRFTEDGVCSWGTSGSLAVGSASTTFEAGYTATTTLTAASVTNYQFTGWYDGDGTLISTDATCTVYPTTNATYYAYYAAMPTATLSLPDNSGSMPSPTATYQRAYYLYNTQATNQDTLIFCPQVMIGGTTTAPNWIKTGASTTTSGGAGYNIDIFPGTNTGTYKSGGATNVYNVKTHRILIRVTNCTEVRVSGNSGGTGAYIKISAYEISDGSGAATAASSATGTTANAKAVTTLSGLTAGKEYLLVIEGTDSSKSNQIAEVALFSPAASSCSATANAGADKSTTVDVGVAMAATAASSGYTGAWSIKASSPSTDAGQLGTTSSNTMTFTPNQSGTYTLVWKVTHNSDATCYASDEATVTVTRNTPTQYSVTGTASICSGDNTDITLADSEEGASYQLKIGGVATGDPKVGTGSALTWNVSTTGTYTVSAVQTTKYSARDMSSSATISSKTATSVSFSDYTLDDAVVGSEYEITGISAAGAGTLTYQWYSYSDDEGSDEKEIDDAESDTYAFTPAAAGDYYFKCEVTADCGSVKSSMITVTATASCTATDPGALSKGTLSGCSRTITASGSAATNNTWYWQSSALGTDKSDAYSSGKTITEAGTYYLRSYCSDGDGCWSDAVSVEITDADMTPSKPTSMSAGTITATGATLSVTADGTATDYEFYVDTDEDAPEAGTTATHSVTGNTSKAISGLSNGTTYYAWVRAVCGSNKSAWTALTGSTFTTLHVYDVSTSLTNVEESSVPSTATENTAYNATFAKATGYNFPTTITVTINSSSATVDEDYTWNSSTGAFQVPAASVTGDIYISMTGVAQTYTISYKDAGGSAYSGNNSGSLPTSHTYGTATDFVNGVKANYTFDGWFTDSDCKSSAGSSIGATAITSNTTYYAKWTAKTAPTQYAVTIDASTVCSGSSTNIKMASSQSGVSYQLYKGEDKVGEAEAGGSAITWSSISATGTYKVMAVENATYASREMSNTVTLANYDAVSIKTHPTSAIAATIGVGSDMSVVLNTGTFNNAAYTWQTCTDATPSSASDISSGSQYSNYNTATMTFTPSSAGTYYFRCKVTDDCGTTVYSNVTTVTVTDGPCFTMTANTSAKSNGSLSHNESITEGSDNCSDLDGGTAKYVDVDKSSSMEVTSDKGWKFNRDKDQIIVTLSAGYSLQEGSVITLSGYANSTGNGIQINGKTVYTKPTSSGSFTDATYTVLSTDAALKGANELVIKRVSGGVYLSSISFSGCDYCVPITPTLNYSKTTFWLDEEVEDRGCSATLNKDGSTGTVTYTSSDDDIVSVLPSGYIYAVGRGTATITASIAADGTRCAAEATCDITVKSIECGNNVIIEAVRTSGASTEASHDGALYGSSAINTYTSGKLGETGKYFGLTLKSGYYFQNGDKLYVKLNTINENGDGIVVTAGLDGSGTVIGSLANASQATNYNNEITLHDVPASTSSLVIYRTKTVTQNPYIDAMKVVRYTCPDVLVFNDAEDDHSWSNADNWVGKAGQGTGVPASTDRVFIKKSVSVDATTAKAGRVHITEGSTMTVNKSVSMGKVEVEPGSTLNVATDGGSAVTLALNTLYLQGGWTTIGGERKYDMPRVYINSASRITKTNPTVNFDISVNHWNYYPIALPFDVALSDVDYARSALASESIYLTHYEIDEYDGQKRANYGGGTSNWKTVTSGTLKAGKGYILSAITDGGKALIRFPMTFTDDWTAGGEKGEVEGEDPKNVITVTAYENNIGGETPIANKGWNLIGVPYMSCYTTGSGMYNEENVDEPATLIQGRFDYKTGKWTEDDVNFYVTVPTHDFTEFKQSPVSEAVLMPGWCFFVQVEETGNLIFLEDQQASSSSSIYEAPHRDKAMPTLKTGIILSGAEASDKTTILVSDKYSAADYEINADLEKMFGENGYTLATYSLFGSTRFAYNALSNADAANIIPIGYRAPADGEYTFSINPRYAENGAFEQVNLIDYETGIMTDLLLYSYTFSTERTQLDTRFALNVVPRQNTPTDIETVGGEGINDANGPRKVLINDKMYIIVDGKMYDATGKAVK